MPNIERAERRPHEHAILAWEVYSRTAYTEKQVIACLQEMILTKKIELIEVGLWWKLK